MERDDVVNDKLRMRVVDLLIVPEEPQAGVHARSESEGFILITLATALVRAFKSARLHFFPPRETIVYMKYRQRSLIIILLHAARSRFMRYAAGGRTAFSGC